VSASPIGVWEKYSLSSNLRELLHLIEDMPAYKELIGQLKQKSGQARKVLALDAAKPFLIAALSQSLPVPVLVITAQPENAKRLYDQISLWSAQDYWNIIPEPDTLPYQRTVSDFSVQQDRLQVLFDLSEAGRKKNPLIISSAASLRQ